MNLLDRCLIKIAKFNYVDKTKALFMLATSPNNSEALNAAMNAVKMMKANNLTFNGDPTISNKANKQFGLITDNYPPERLVNFARAVVKYLRNEVLYLIESNSYDEQEVDTRPVTSFNDSLFSHLERIGKDQFKPINIGSFIISIQAGDWTDSKPQENLPNGDMYEEFEVEFWEAGANFAIRPLEDIRFNKCSWAKFFSKIKMIGCFVPKSAILEMITTLRNIEQDSNTDKSYDNLPSSLFNNDNEY